MPDQPYKPTKEELAQWAYIERLPISVRYPVRRKACLERCLRFRRLIQNPETIAVGNGIEAAKMGLKRDQMLLVKLRIWRSTGRFPSQH
jgi:hypothetical protein